MSRELGRKLKAARIEAGFDNPEAIARRVGRTKRMITNYERGDVVPPADVLQKWAETTGKPLEYFLPSPEPAPVATTPQQHPGVEALAAILRGDRDHAIADAELDDLRDSTWAQPIATPGEALDLLLARRRARRERSGRMRSE